MSSFHTSWVLGHCFVTPMYKWIFTSRISSQGNRIGLCVCVCVCVCVGLWDLCCAPPIVYHWPALCTTIHYNKRTFGQKDCTIGDRGRYMNGQAFLFGGGPFSEITLIVRNMSLIFWPSQAFCPLIPFKDPLFLSQRPPGFIQPILVRKKYSPIDMPKANQDLGLLWGVMILTNNSVRSFFHICTMSFHWINVPVPTGQ